LLENVQERYMVSARPKKVFAGVVSMDGFLFGTEENRVAV
jgi:hypothetical protein